MNLKNESYVIFIRFGDSKEKYYKDKKGWLKISSRGRVFRMTAEQLLNHILPALAGLKKGVRIEVKHRE